ncbi:galactose oxidase [Gigaspora margarita]|uniref:Galactose oxidase n=1 Tax=Gigaspora margarita TaxID=4874 RepID=A0A8H3X563_GIGMA|nr:galactose oxidase [Gigaspora margarita]
MPWTDLSSISGVTCKTGATACADETTIYYIGGTHSGGLVSKFDTISLQWSEPTTSGSIPTSPYERPGEEMKLVQCVTLGHKIYIYGASSTFGGCQTNSNQELPISIYNTNDNTWRIVTTSGQIPTRKCNHASVYIPQHNRILLFYGADDITINSLDTFTWTIPVILNSGGPLRRLVGHTATMIGAYVLIAFGFYLTDEVPLTSSDIFLLDVSHKDSYKWVTTYDPINSIQPIPASPTSPSNINIGIVIAGTIGLLIIVVAQFPKSYFLTGHLPDFTQD